MATFVENGTKIKVLIRRQGVKMCRTFDNMEEAEEWANLIENRIKKNAKAMTKAERLIELEPLAHLIPPRILEALSSIPFTLKQITDAAMPATTASGIYFLIKRKEVIYVGQSATDVLGRIAKHRRSGRAFDSYSIIHCEKDKLDQMEAHYISAFMPVLNFSLGRVLIERPENLDCPKTVQDIQALEGEIPDFGAQKKRLGQN